MMVDGFDFGKAAGALLDTNVLKEMTQKTKRAESFRPVFNFLRENNIEPYIIDATKYEFVGFSTNKRDYDALEAVVKDFWSHPISQEEIKQATELSALYKCKNPSLNPRQISFVDCLHAVKLLHFKTNSVIVTTDINDYPSFLFDMPHYLPIDEGGGSTSFVGFKTYNESKYKELKESWVKSGS